MTLFDGFVIVSSDSCEFYRCGRLKFEVFLFCQGGREKKNFELQPAASTKFARVRRESDRSIEQDHFIGSSVKILIFKTKMA